LFSLFLNLVYLFGLADILLLLHSYYKTSNKFNYELYTELTKMSQNQNSKANHFLSISSKKKVDLAVGGAVKSFKDSLSSSHSMCQKAKIFDPSEFKDFLKN